MDASSGSAASPFPHRASSGARPVELNAELSVTDVGAGVDSLVVGAGRTASDALSGEAATRVALVGASASYDVTATYDAGSPYGVFAITKDVLGNTSDTLALGSFAAPASAQTPIQPLFAARQRSAAEIAIYLVRPASDAVGYQWALGTTPGASDLRAFPSSARDELGFSDEQIAAALAQAGSTVGDLQALPSSPVRLRGTFDAGADVYLSVRAVNADGATSVPVTVKTEVPRAPLDITSTWLQDHASSTFKALSTAVEAPSGVDVALKLYRIDYHRSFVGSGTYVSGSSKMRSGTYELEAVANMGQGMSIRQTYRFGVNRSAIGRGSKVVLSTSGAASSPEMTAPTLRLSASDEAEGQRWIASTSDLSVEVTDASDADDFEIAVVDADSTALVDWAPAVRLAQVASGAALSVPEFDADDGARYQIVVRRTLASIAVQGPPSSVAVAFDSVAPSIDIASASAAPSSDPVAPAPSAAGDASITVDGAAVLTGSFDARSIDAPDATGFGLTALVSADDAHSGLARVEWALSTDADPPDTLGRTQQVDSDEPTLTGAAQAADRYLHARPVDAAGNVGAVETATLASGSASPLGAPSVAIRATSDDAASVYFLGATAGAVAGYQWALGTQAGSDDLRAWPSGGAPDAQALTSEQVSALVQASAQQQTLSTLADQPAFAVGLPDLEAGQAWYLSVRAVDAQGAVGPVVFAPGTQRVPPPFGIALTLSSKSSFPPAYGLPYYDLTLNMAVISNAMGATRISAQCPTFIGGYFQSFTPSGKSCREYDAIVRDKARTFTMEFTAVGGSRVERIRKKITLTGRTMTVEDVP